MEIKKLYYRISEISDALGEPQSTIRYWCREFDINPKRNKVNYRQFQKDDIVKLGAVRFLLGTQKFTVKGAKMALTDTKLAERVRRMLNL